MGNAGDPKAKGTDLSRRDFFQKGAAVGVGAVALGAGPATSAAHAARLTWDYEADIVVIGAGAAGLPAAIRARDLGCSVIVVDQNFEIGGRMLHSGGEVSLGGGDAVQMRDIAGASDADGFIKVPPLMSKEALQDSPDLLFEDETDWSICNTGGRARYRYNYREIVRAWADHCVATRQFLMDNYVRFARISQTHMGGGLSRARSATGIFLLADKTDMRAGTVTQDDAGHPGKSSSRFAVRIMADDSYRARPGIVGRGTAVARPLEFSAKEKGVQFILNRHMDEIIRESNFSGRVLGIKASFTPRTYPHTGEQLVSYGEFVGGEWAKGLIKDERATLMIRARKAVIVSAGGNQGNPLFRSMFHPGGLEPFHPSNGWSLLGGPGRANDASGILAGMRVGANLAGMEQGYHNGNARNIKTMIGAMDAGEPEFPGNPTFSLRGAAGLTIGAAGFEHLIAVNQVGKRFYNEMQVTFMSPMMTFPQQGATVPWNKYVHGDWRNCSAETVRRVYKDDMGVEAALAINEGSQPPDYLPGPIWAIFDQAAVDRTKWKVEPPWLDYNGLFFKADTLEELADAIKAGNPHQRVPLKYLKETVARWNAFAAKGSDPDFERESDAPMHALTKPPFYAASLLLEWHDSEGGLRVNGKMQVMDTQGKVIPGLYAGGETAGGHEMHGLGRAIPQGYIAGTNAAAEPTSAAVGRLRKRRS
jgi:FAD binding domain